MQFRWIFLLMIISAAISCTSRTSKNNTVAPLSDTAKFYPLDHFFREQIQYVDLHDFPIYRVTMQDGNKDSVAISKEEFIQLASAFLKKELLEPSIKVQYKENVFNDLSTGSITLNYTPVNENLEVQNIDILLTEETSSVKRVFIRSQYKKGDTTVLEQCNWKADKSFQINRSFSTAKGYAATQYNYINWNDKP